jgi:hypothetical protein
MTESLWDGTGIPADTEEAMELCGELDFIPAELQAVVDYLRREAWVWEHVARTHPDPDKCYAMAAYFRRRATRFTELVALIDREADEFEEEEENDS